MGDGLSGLLGLLAPSLLPTAQPPDDDVSWVLSLLQGPGDPHVGKRFLKQKHMEFQGKLCLYC